MSKLSKQKKYEVWARAGFRCEYCKTSMRLIGMSLVIDHIQPQAKGGDNALNNLAAACYRCNEYKGARVQGTDPETQEDAALFNPRQQDWLDHFAWDSSGTTIIGLTPVGRASIEVLRLNNDDVVAARRIWVQWGWHPPNE